MEDRARIWEIVQHWFDETHGPASQVASVLFHDVDSVRALFDTLSVELPAWYRRKYGPWLRPSPRVISISAWAGVLADMAQSVPRLPAPCDEMYSWASSAVRARGSAARRPMRASGRVVWQRLLGRRVAERWIRAPPSSAELWRRAKQADRCVVAMVGLSRVLTRDLCWTILVLLELVD